MNRRALLATTMLAPLAACGVVTSTTTNGVTTVTINVAKIDSYAKAFGAFTSAVAGVSGIAPFLTTIEVAESMALQDLAAFDAATNGQLVLTFDATSVPASVTSILDDGRAVLAAIQTALPQSAIVGTVLDAFNAVKTIVMLFEALLPSFGAVAASRVPMSEAQALAVLGVK